MAEVDAVERRRARAPAFARLVWKRLKHAQCLAAAASLSYTSLLALVPLIAIGFAVLSAFPVFEDVQANIQTFIFDNFLPSAVESAKAYVEEFVGKARTLTAIGVVGLTITAMLLLSTIEEAMNAIFGVTRTRPLGSRLTMFWATLTAGPLLVGASLSIATLLVGYTRSVAGETGGTVVGFVASTLPTLFLILAFALCYTIVPDRPVRLRHAVVGATVAGIAFAVLRWGFTLYITSFPTYQTLYGALAVVPIALVWMYLSWVVVLVGAVVTASLPDWSTADDAAGGDEPAATLRLAVSALQALFASLGSDGGLRRRDLAEATETSLARIDDMLSALRGAGYVDETVGGLWLPRRDPASVTVYSLARDLGLVAPATVAEPSTDGPPWRHRLDALLAADTEQRRALLDVDLQNLLQPAATPGRAEPAPLSFRRTP